MAVKDKATIKSYFQRGLKPTQQNYIDLVDSYQDTGSSDAFTPIGQALVNSSTQASARSAIGIDFVTTAQAVAGAIATGGMNPVLVKNEIQSFTQFATTAAATTGTDSTGYMNPVLVKNAISTLGVNGWVPIKTVTASNVTSVDFVNGSSGVVLDSTYKAYVIKFNAVLPSSGTPNLLLRTSSNTGVSYNSGSTDYKVGLYGLNQASFSTNVTADADTIWVGGQNLSLDTTQGIDGWIYIEDPSDSTRRTNIYTQTIYNNGNLAQDNGVACRASNAAVNAVRIYMSANNLYGTFTLYGLANAP